MHSRHLEEWLIHRNLGWINPSLFFSLTHRFSSCWFFSCLKYCHCLSITISHSFYLIWYTVNNDIFFTHKHEHYFSPLKEAPMVVLFFPEDWSKLLSMRLILILVIKIPFLLCQVLGRPFTIISFTPNDHPQRWVLLPPLCGWQDRGLEMGTLLPCTQLAITELDMKSKAMWLPGPSAHSTPHQTLISLLFPHPRSIKPPAMFLHVWFICTWCPLDPQPPC